MHDTDAPEQGRPLTAVEFFTLLSKGHAPPPAPWGDESESATPDAS